MAPGIPRIQTTWTGLDPDQSYSWRQWNGPVSQNQSEEQASRSKHLPNHNLQMYATSSRPHQIQMLWCFQPTLWSRHNCQVETLTPARNRASSPQSGLRSNFGMPKLLGGNPGNMSQDWDHQHTSSSSSIIIIIISSSSSTSLMKSHGKRKKSLKPPAGLDPANPQLTQRWL